MLTWLPVCSHSAFPSALGDALQVDVSGKADGRSDQELETSYNKHPDPGFLERWEQKQDAPHEKPDGNQEVVCDAKHFISSPDDKFFFAEFYRQGRIN